MIEFKGTYFDGKSSRAQIVRAVNEGWAIILYDEKEFVKKAEYTIDQCKFIPPLGKTKREICFKDGAVLETPDTEKVKEIEDHFRINQVFSFISFLENSWKIVFLSLSILLVVVFCFYKFGIPLIADAFSESIPKSIIEKMSDETMEVLDQGYLDKTTIDLSTQATVSTIFYDVCGKMDSSGSYLLVFRKCPFGPNSFALPSGTVIITDELIKLAENPENLRGVFAHEIAHVKYRHPQRSILQNAGVFLLISALTGDITSITTVSTTLPLIFMKTGYSRSFEKEADLWALDYLYNTIGNTDSYLYVMEKMKDYFKIAPPEWLSTHPDFEKRIKMIKKFKKN